MLPRQENGYLKYKNVPPYDLKWLPVDKDNNPVPEEQRVSFDPAAAWTEDRWVFCRRMSGDELCQHLFYDLCNFVWTCNKIYDNDLHEHQVVVLRRVFRIKDIDSFRSKFKGPLWVNTWDDAKCVWMTSKQIGLMSSEAMIIGPLAAMFGREIQQQLMASTLPRKIAADDFTLSVESGRTSLSKRKVDETWNQDVGADLRGTVQIQKYPGPAHHVVVQMPHGSHSHDTA